MLKYSKEQLLEKLNDLNIELDELRSDYSLLQDENEDYKESNELLRQEYEQLQKDNEYLTDLLKDVYKVVKDFD